jgi:replicative DNA helicase
MVADACTFSCGELYDLQKQKWIRYGSKESTLFIATEQQLSEIQTAMLAFLSGVNEEHILTNDYEAGEWERIEYAANVLKNAPLHIKCLPDFSLQDIENTIKFAVSEWDIRMCTYDYLHSSMKILSEVTSKAKVQGLREDNVLFMISTRLKDLCNKYGIFILTSTQLNGSWADAEILDQNCLRGAKSIADRIDLGMIMAGVTERDKEALIDVCAKLGCEMPTVKISVYKNRRGRWKDILLWCKADKGICRIDPVFVTDYSYVPLEIENYNIQTWGEA